MRVHVGTRKSIRLTKNRAQMWNILRKRSQLLDKFKCDFNVCEKEIIGIYNGGKKLNGCAYESNARFMFQVCLGVVF